MLPAILGAVFGILPSLLGLLASWNSKRMLIKMMKIKHQMLRDKLITEESLKYLEHEGSSERLMYEAAKDSIAMKAVTILRASIRPGITILFVGFYLAVKLGAYSLIVYDLHNHAAVLANIFTPFDRDLLQLVVTFWFTSRALDYVFRIKR